MQHWNKTLLGFALLGLVLLINASIQLICAPSHLYGKLVVFTGGLLTSISAMILQVWVWHRCQGVQKEKADLK